MGEQTGKGGQPADVDGRGQAEIEGRAGTAPREAADAPPAGPHADPALTNPDATPGTGSLPAPSDDDEAAAGTG